MARIVLTSLLLGALLWPGALADTVSTPNPTQHTKAGAATEPSATTNSNANPNLHTPLTPAIRNDTQVSPRVKELFAEAVHLLKINRAYEARGLLEQALALAPRSAGIRCNLGLAYQNSGNIPKAIQEYKAALELSPRMPEALLNLAGCHQSMGANAEAIKWYTTYLDDNPGGSQNKQITDIIAALKATINKPGSDPSLGDYFKNIIADGVYRWPKERMPIRVFIENGDAEGKSVEGFKGTFKHSLIDAFEEWSQASGRRITYQIVPNKERADIYCTWTSDPLEVTENGTQSERGSAKIIVKGSRIERGTVKILTRPILEEGILSEDEVKKACLHEVGHVLGLQGHSTNNHDVMFFTVDTATVWPILSKRDKSTIAKLYLDYPGAAANPIRQSSANQ